MHVKSHQGVAQRSWEMLFLFVILVLASTMFFMFGGRMNGVELPPPPKAPAVRINDAEEVFNYRTGSAEAKKTDKPLVTFVGGETRGSVPGAVVAVENKPLAPWWPDRGVVVSVWVKDRHVGRVWDKDSYTLTDPKTLTKFVARLVSESKGVSSVSTTLVTKDGPYHTHTCSKGHTWDHSQDGGTHRCPVCGESQFVVDSVSRPVTTRPSLLPGRVYGPGCGPNGCPNTTRYQVR